jgi:pimeloyl-ACP methyl ester carboxylesterase
VVLVSRAPFAVIAASPGHAEAAGRFHLPGLLPIIALRARGERPFGIAPGRAAIRAWGGDMKELLLVPALGCDARLYGEIAPHLDALIRTQTIIPDRDSFAGCVEQLLAAEPDRFVVLGTSFGGRVALETVLAAPERVEGLIVIGSTPGPLADPVAGRRRSERLRGGEFEAVVREMADIITHRPGPNGEKARELFIAMARTQGSALMARQSDALAGRVDRWPRLAGIACPALMLWGRHDQFAPAAEGLRMAAAVPRGRFVEIADCGHLPTLEAPMEAFDAITHWLVDSGLA